MPIRSRMTSIMGQIEPELPELFALEFGKIAEHYFVYPLFIYNYQPISTKLGQNVCDHKISYEQFLLFPLFSKDIIMLQTGKNQGMFGKGLTTVRKKPFENIVGKGENAGFSFSHNVFYPLQNKFKFFSHIYFVICKCFQFGLSLNFVVW